MTSHLANHPAAHGERRRIAALVGVSVRTLFEWSRRGGQAGRRGRPPRSAQERQRAREQVEPVWRLLVRGHRGVGSVQAQLARSDQPVPTRLLREVVRELNCERAQRERTRIKAACVHTRILVRDAVWALDQMTLGRDAHGEIRALHVRECLVPLTLAASVGPPARAQDVVLLLEQAARERGVWPLVVQADNGSENKNAAVLACLREHQVIVLWNLPHTPQHNPRAERMNGALQRASELDKRSRRGVRHSRAECAARLAWAWEALDGHTPRRSLGNQTPRELDRQTPRALDRVCRDCFYREVSEEHERIAGLPCTARERRKLAREAVWAALERGGLVQRTRGGLPVGAFKPEGIT